MFNPELKQLIHWFNPVNILWFKWEHTLLLISSMIMSCSPRSINESANVSLWCSAEDTAETLNMSFSVGVNRAENISCLTHRFIDSSSSCWNKNEAFLCSSAETRMLLSCSVASVSLTYFRLSVFSPGWLHLSNVGPALQWRGLKVEAVSIMPSI